MGAGKDVINSVGLKRWKLRKNPTLLVTVSMSDSIFRYQYSSLRKRCLRTWETENCSQAAGWAVGDAKRSFVRSGSQWVFRQCHWQAKPRPFTRRSLGWCRGIECLGELKMERHQALCLARNCDPEDSMGWALSFCSDLRSFSSFSFATNSTLLS